MSARLPFDDQHAPVFTVGQVAEAIGVQPAFLRRLDQLDVVSPARSSGSQRRYSRNDVALVQQACTLIGEGLTLAGVRRVFELEAEVRELKAEIAALRDLSAPAAPIGSPGADNSRARRGR